MKLQNTILYLSTILLLSACYDNVDNTKVIQQTPNDTPIYISTAVTGSVLSPSGDATTGYSISANDHSEVIDQKIFLLELEDINKKGQAVYAYRDGEVISMLHTQLIENDINHIELQMFNPINSSLINSSDPTSISIQSEILLSMNADILRDESGNIPTDAITVKYRDLSDLDNMSQLGLSAYNRGGQLLLTHHNKAFYYSPTSTSGSSLSIASDEYATIDMSNIQSDLALFHFDQEMEQWNFVKDINTGNSSIQISQTGYFTISSYQKAIYSEGSTHRSGDHISYQSMQWKSNNLQHTYSSTAHGRWITLQPQNEDVEHIALTPCGDMIQSFIVSASQDNINSIDIDINLSHNTYYRLQTQVYDCQGSLEQASAIHIDNSTQINIYTFDDDSAYTWLPVCYSEFALAAYDIDLDQSGPSVPWRVDLIDERSYLINCKNLENGYSYIKVRNEMMVLPAFNTQKVEGKTILQSQNQKIKFFFTGEETGMYDTEDVHMILDDETFGDAGYFISCANSAQGCGFDDWNVTHYEAGEKKWVRVSFAGDIWMQTIDPPVAGYYFVEGVILCQAE